MKAWPIGDWVEDHKPIIENIISGGVLLYVLWIGVDVSQWLPSTLHQWVNNLFTLFFFTEILYLLGFSPTWRSTFTKRNIATLLIDLGMVVEFWVLPLHRKLTNSTSRSPVYLKLFFLLRIWRILHSLRLSRFPAIESLIQNIQRSLMVALGALSLLVYITYLFALFFVMDAQFSQVPFIKSEMGSIGNAMYRLWMTGVWGEDYAETFFMYYESPRHRHMAFLFGVFVFLAAISLLNILVGLHIDILLAAQRKSHDEAIRKKSVKKLGEIFGKLPSFQKDRVAWGELRAACRAPSVAQSIKTAGVSTKQLCVFLKIARQDDSQSLEELVTKLHHFTHQTASSLHLETLGSEICQDVQSLGKSIQMLQDQLGSFPSPSSVLFRRPQSALRQLTGGWLNFQ